MSSPLRSAALPVLLAVSIGTARAESEEANLFENTFYVSLGTFIVGTDTRVQVNGQAAVGDEIDLEKTFGVSDKQRFRIDGYWRFADRHKVRFLWFERSAQASRVLEDGIEFDGTIFPASTRVKLTNDFAVYELAYEYVVLQRPNFELSGSFGLHYAEFSAELDGKASPIGGGTVEATLRGTASLDAPLPVIGLRGLWHVGRNWWLDASAQFFALEIDSYSGNLQDYRAAISWQPKPYAGVGFGYNAFRVNVDLDTSDFRGSLDWAYYGPQVFFTASF